MDIADKYMSEVNDKQFRFIPPKFNGNLFRNDEESIMGGEINNPFDGNVNEDNLFPSETNKDQLYCYYNSLGDCYKGNESANSNVNSNSKKNDYEKYIPMQTMVRLPLPSDILRHFDLELDEEADIDENRRDSDVNRVYSEIEANNPNVINVFSDYQIPSPIAKVITKRIVKLSLQYYNRGEV